MAPRWWRIVVGGLFIFLLPTASLVLVTLAGPRDPAGAADFAAGASRWATLVGSPLAGLLVGWLVAQPLVSGQVIHALLAGTVGALLDALAIAVSGTPWSGELIAARVACIVAAALGGWLASSRTRNASTSPRG